MNKGQGMNILHHTLFCCKFNIDSVVSWESRYHRIWSSVQVSCEMQPQCCPYQHCEIHGNI